MDSDKDPSSEHSFRVTQYAATSLTKTKKGTIMCIIIIININVVLY